MRSLRKAASSPTSNDDVDSGFRSVLVYDIRNDVRSVACAREILFVNDTPVSKKSSMSWAGACHLDVVGSPCLPFASHFARSYSSGARYP